MLNSQDTFKVLILGAGGMLGSAMFRFFSHDSRFKTFGTLRSSGKKRHFASCEQERLLININVENSGDLLSVFALVRPDLVINCVGVIKQVDASRNQLTTLELNSILPHRLVQYCQLVGARLVHMGTDCVFSGVKGGYTENDFADANDLYGRSKYLGEVNYPNAVTLRTSIIGHELESNNSLIDWFLSQNEPVKGYTNAVFSGLPTVEVARVIRDFVIPNEGLSGVYHLSAEPIDKFALLQMVKKTYGRHTEIIPDGELAIDRSLNSNRFREKTGFKPKPWPDLVFLMYENYLQQLKVATGM